MPSVFKYVPFGGFDKNDTEEYIMRLIQKIQALETEQGISPLTEFQPELLKKSAFGLGYNKESVLEYKEILMYRLMELKR